MLRPNWLILSTNIWWNNRPNPTGIVTYGAFNPNVKEHATALLSILSLFINGRRGGIKIGIKAICTGTKFCEKHAMNASEKITNIFFPERTCESFLDKIVPSPDCAKPKAKAPNKI